MVGGAPGGTAPPKEARLERAVSRVVNGTAREVRDTILGDLSNFKGDAEQADDITVVVARIK